VPSSEIRVAYIVTAHKHPQQVARMVRRLAVPGTAFLIHVDRKADPSVERGIRSGIAGFENVHFLDRQPVHWGHFSLLGAIVRALAAMRDLGLDPDQTVISTGQDYPIADPEAIARRLSSESELAYVLYSALPNMDWWPSDRGGLDRLERVYLRMPRRGMVRTRLKRRIPHGWRPYGGGANLALGRPHREYVQDLIASDPRAVRFFRRGNTPDETFFQTVLMNSPLRDSVVNDHLLYARWQQGANHPDLLGIEDLGEALASSALFARKFDSEHDPEVLDELERRVERGLDQPTAGH